MVVKFDKNLDKWFDRFELYVLRNIFVLPEDIEIPVATESKGNKPQLLIGRNDEISYTSTQVIDLGTRIAEVCLFHFNMPQQKEENTLWKEKIAQLTQEKDTLQTFADKLGVITDLCKDQNSTLCVH